MLVLKCCQPLHFYTTHGCTFTVSALRMLQDRSFRLVLWVFIRQSDNILTFAVAFMQTTPLCGVRVLVVLNFPDFIYHKVAQNRYEKIELTIFLFRTFLWTVFSHLTTSLFNFRIFMVLSVYYM